MDKVRLGVIGCGVIGPTHMRAAVDSSTIELVAVADLVEEKRNKAAAEYGVPKVYAHSDALLSDPDIDAVVLAVPAGDRIEMPLQAMASGKHVLVEKPVGINAAVVQQWIAAQGNLVAACCSSRYQSVASTQAAQAFVATGALGQLRTVHARNFSPAGKAPASCPPDWRLKKARNGGGILTNWGCYDMDFLLSITGWTLKPKTVLARTWTIPPRLVTHAAPNSDAETHFTAFILCEDGIAFTFERAEYIPRNQAAAWEFIGDDGSLQLTMTLGGTKTITFGEAVTGEGLVPRTIWEGEDDGALVSGGPVLDFADAILTGKRPRTDLPRALVIAQITDAIYASAERGTAVEVGDVSLV